VPSVNVLATVDLLVGRVSFSFPRFRIFGRSEGLLVEPLATSFAYVSTSSLPGMPTCPGVHLRVILFTSTVFRVEVRVLWKRFIR
jgi:hypothetical protein